MTRLDDVRRIASRLPGSVANLDGFGFSVPHSGKVNGFVHTWRERVHPKKTKVPNSGVLVVVVRNLSEKEIILGSDVEKFFTEPHYNGYAAILVRLAAIEPDELEDLIVEAWRCKASAELIEQFENA